MKNKRWLFWVVVISTFFVVTKWYYIKTQRSEDYAVSPSPHIPTLNSTSNWPTYDDSGFSFEIKHRPNLRPDVERGTEETGPFSYLTTIDFGSPPLQTEYGFSIEINQMKALEVYRLELVGHYTDKIDSEEESSIAGIRWHKFNYSVSSTEGDTKVTTAAYTSPDYGYSVTAKSENIDQILSTFKILE